MTFESEGLFIAAIYIWLPPASYVVFLTTLVKKFGKSQIAIYLSFYLDSIYTVIKLGL